MVPGKASSLSSAGLTLTEAPALCGRMPDRHNMSHRGILHAGLHRRSCRILGQIRRGPAHLCPFACHASIMSPAAGRYSGA